MFQGAAALNLDAKGRLAIPARHRDALAVDNGQVVLTAHPHGCCLVYPVPAWIPIRDQVLAAPGLDPQSGVLWLKAPDGVFGIQSLGVGVTPAHLPGIASAHFYRVTAVGVRGPSRTVLESVYARYQPTDSEAGEPVRQQFRRIMWRQIQ